MPTVLNIYGLRVVIYLNDHRPAHVHVHVIGGGCEAVFALNCPDGPPSVAENYGFSHKTLGNVACELGNNISRLCKRWREIHEYY